MGDQFPEQLLENVVLKFEAEILSVFKAPGHSSDLLGIPRRRYIQKLTRLVQMGQVKRKGSAWFKEGAPFQHIKGERRKIRTINQVAV